LALFGQTAPEERKFCPFRVLLDACFSFNGFPLEDGREIMATYGLRNSEEEEETEEKRSAADCNVRVIVGVHFEGTHTSADDTLVRHAGGRPIPQESRAAALTRLTA
jgi:hypothetical protein